MNEVSLEASLKFKICQGRPSPGRIAERFFGVPNRKECDNMNNHLPAACDACAAKPCRSGDLSTAPKNCPSLGVSPEESLARYSQEDRRTACIAAEVECDGYCRLTRVEEIMEYTRRCGYRKLGLAFCAGLSKEAGILARILRGNGFEVVTVCCKNGSVSKDQLGIPKEKQLKRGEAFEAMCNPAGQAAVLNEAGCELDLLLGLCVGHDTLFIKNAGAPITVVAVKDRVTGHNPLAPIYTFDSYGKRLLPYRFVGE